jgi:hypothetical protein
VSYNVIEKFTSITVLHYHVKFFLGFDDFIELDDVWVSDFLKNFYFSCDAFDIFLIVDFVLLKNLYCNLNDY